MEFSFADKVALITVVFTAAGTVASIRVINNARFRNTIFIALGLSLAFVLGLLAWPMIGRGGAVVVTPPSPTPTPGRARPTPSPSPSKTASTANKALPPEAEASEATPLYVSSMNDASARARHCVVADFTAESRPGAKAFDVTVTEANLSLCNYSAHGSRKIKIRVGYRGGKAGQVYWSRPVTLTDGLYPGQTITLSDPIRLSIPRRGSANLSNHNFVVELINVPADTNREMRYYVS